MVDNDLSEVSQYQPRIPHIRPGCIALIAPVMANVAVVGPLAISKSQLPALIVSRAEGEHALVDGALETRNS